MARITKLLIANRGEIARRIMRTAREMGISTVAVYAEPDSEAPFVREADVAVSLRGTTSQETYLDIEKILEAAHHTGADGVHPGYGFLAENAEFARAVTDAGLTWVGPHPQAIATMGDKLAAKKLMTDAKVPTLSTVKIARNVTKAVRKRANDLGYPLLVKAAAGGGGKGMRVVSDDAALAEAVSAARREAAGAFGDDTVFLERFLEGSGHVEVQIFGDSHGTIAHCFERECSIQRRHQKIIEEAPSPAVDAELRTRLGEAAVQAAKAVGYDNAGTVEFMLDKDSNFYFLEMNTRLQVEHPVTEEITGLDLVREQIRVAEGDPISFRQEDLRIEGHAIEARVYAEDPANDFLPATGRLVAWRPDPALPARFESGVETGSEVSPYFDPMLAKVIVHARDRTEAALRLANVLDRLQLQGVTSNREFLVNVLRHDAFLSGDTSTDFIETHRPSPTHKVPDDEARAAALAVALTSQEARRADAQVLASIPSGWRNNPSAMQKIVYTHGGEEIVTEYSNNGNGAFDYQVNGHRGTARIVESEGGRIELEVEGIQRTLSVVSQGADHSVHGPAGEILLVEAPRFPQRERERVVGGYLAPMPGRIVSVNVKVGQKVKAGEVLMIVEAMKMEHIITCAEGGIVKEVRVQAEEQVEAGHVLLVIDTGKDES
jgi:acetyl/propionyl-CoA carboxylase alpha subunit